MIHVILHCSELSVTFGNDLEPIWKQNIFKYHVDIKQINPKFTSIIKYTNFEANNMQTPYGTEMGYCLNQWANSTGLTAVNTYKPRLPGQWAVGTHHKGLSRMEQVTFRMNRQSEIRLKFKIKFSLLEMENCDWFTKPITLFHFQYV